MKDYIKNAFDLELLSELRSKFAFVDADPDLGERIFFDNSGGSLRLKEAIDVRYKYDLIPDCTERFHERAQKFHAVIKKGTDDVLKIILGAKGGSLMTQLSASQTIFQGVEAIMEGVDGTNAVTTNIEHPSSYDAVQYYCEKHNREMRVVKANITTGFIDPEDVAALVDTGTVLVNIIASSNISGNIMDMERIVKLVREKNPNVYIMSDAVQHAPHGVIDVEKLQIDFMNFAPYKFYATRGIGVAYISDRMSKLSHHKLLAKDDSVWELGTPATALFASITAVVDYVCAIGSKFSSETDRRELYCEGMRRIESQERALLQRLLLGSNEVEGLRTMEGVTIFSDGDDLERRDLIVAMSLDGRDLTECVKEYQKRGVTVFDRVNSNIYSKRIVEALGFEGAIRVSPMHCHNFNDIDRFLKITKDIVASGVCKK